MKFNQMALATLTTSLLIALPGQATTRPGGHGQSHAIHVQNGEQVSAALAASRLAVEGVEGARLYQAMQDGRISQQALQRLLDPNLPEEFHPLGSQIVQAAANLSSGLNTTRFSTAATNNTGNIGDSLGRITELTIQKLNGQQTETSTAKMIAITEIINNYAQSAKTEIDMEAAQQQAREVLNQGTEEPIVTPEQDPFDLIKNCR